MPVSWNPARLTAVGAVNQAATGTEQNTDPGRHPFFQTGRLFQALISSRQDDGRFVLDVGKYRFLAESRQPLQIGSRLNLQVTSVAPRLKLQVVSDPLTRHIGRSIHLLSRPLNLQQALRAISQHTTDDNRLTPETRRLFEQFSQPDQIINSKEKSGEQLKAMIMGLRRHVGSQGNAPRKGEAALIRNSLPEAARLPHEGDSAGNRINHLLQTLDLFQLLGIKFEQEEQFFAPLPLPFLDQGYLIVDKEKKEKNSDAAESRWTYSLHLKMKGLGSLRIEIQQLRTELEIHFYCEDREKAHFLAGLREKLRRQLDLFTLEKSRFHTGVREPVPEILQKIIRKNSGIINTTM